MESLQLLNSMPNQFHSELGKLIQQTLNYDVRLGNTKYNKEGVNRGYTKASRSNEYRLVLPYF